MKSNMIAWYGRCSCGEALYPIDEFDTLEEAQEMLSEYRMAFGKDWKIWIQ